MAADIALTALIAWALWAATLLVLMAFTPRSVPSYNGFTIYIPPPVFAILTEKELLAVTMHEEGHRLHGHVWKNYLGAVFFIPASINTRMRQELEADDYADFAGLGLPLASALIKMGAAHPFDLYRIRSLKGDLHNG